MDESSIAFSKLICRVTELDNELRRFRTEAETSSSDIQRLIQEKQLLEERLSVATAEHKQAKAALVEATDHFHSQDELHDQELKTLRLQLQLPKDELNSVLKQRSEIQTSLKTQNYELHHEVKRWKQDFEVLQSQRSSQVQLSDALSTELSTMKIRLQEAKLETTRVEKLMEDYYHRVQQSFVQPAQLIARLTRRKSENQELTKQVQSLSEDRRRLEQTLEQHNEASKVTGHQITMLQRDLHDAHNRIKEEQYQKNRIVQLLKESEEENSKLEEMVDKQAETILSLQQSKVNPVVSSVETPKTETTCSGEVQQIRSNETRNEAVSKPVESTHEEKSILDELL